MLIILAGILCFFLLFTGIGLVYPFNGLLRKQQREEFFSAFWVGLAVAITLLQIWHLFSPVNTSVLIILTVVSLAGWGMHWRLVRGWLGGVSIGKWLMMAFALALTLAVFSIQSIWGQVHFDHGLYHLQMVKWIENYAIIPGLGNLHHRFAFNNSSFLLVALINSGPFYGYAYYITSSLLCFVVALRALYSLVRLFLKEGQGRLGDVFQALLFPCVLYYIATAYFTGYSPDVAVFALQAALAGELISVFSTVDNDPGSLVRVGIRIVIIAALSVTVKLSAVVFAATSVLVVLFLLLRKRKVLDLKAPFVPFSAGAVILLAAGWMLRSVILSGYLLYPSSLISFDVPWKIPKSMVDPIAPTIRHWALYRSSAKPDLPLFEWARVWSGHIPFEVKAGALAIMVLMVLMAFLKLRQRKRPLEWKGPVVLFGIAVAGLLYWFLSAPDFRFLGAIFWLLAIAPLLIFYQQLLNGFPKLSPRLLSGLMLVGMILWLRPPLVLEMNKQMLVVPPSENAIAAQQVSGGDAPFQITTSGLKVYTANDLSKEACWDEPLPCTRLNDFDHRLYLLNPRDMQEGFAIQE